MKKLLLQLSIVTLLATTLSARETMKVEVENVSIDAPLGWLAQYTKTPQVFFLYSPPDAKFKEKTQADDNFEIWVDKVGNTLILFR